MYYDDWVQFDTSNVVQISENIPDIKITRRIQGMEGEGGGGSKANFLDKMTFDSDFQVSFNNVYKK